MELLLVFLSTAIGTVVGVIAVTMMQRKDRKTAVGAGSVLRTQLQNTEWALASAGRDVEELRQKLMEREQSVQTAAQEMESLQKRLMETVAEGEKEVGRRTEAERLASEASAQIQILLERIHQLENATAQSERAFGHITELESEMARLRQAAMDAEAGNASLQREFATESQKFEALAAELATLQSEHAALQAAIWKERALTAEGLDLLQKAQAKLAGAAPVGAAGSVTPSVNGFALVG
ncbi:MAG TPA: hypothetical protein VMA31_09635 [Bryobacteraceae bacterium]|nr:hypothetical protein [Bryobacteraceae bacterium]